MNPHVMATKREYFELLQCSYKEELCYVLRCPDFALDTKNGTPAL